jgi:hypothetical protein
MKNVPHALTVRHVKKICEMRRVDQKKGRQTYRNRSERPPPYTPMIRTRDFWHVVIKCPSALLGVPILVNGS